LSVVYRLPNKVYYSQLRGVDDATLQRNLLSVMAYSLLELGSFLMLSYVLQRKVGISSIRQLAFVLSSQWQVAQCKFVLWLVHSCRPLWTTLAPTSASGFSGCTAIQAASSEGDLADFLHKSGLESDAAFQVSSKLDPPQLYASTLCLYAAAISEYTCR
jgi:hypothetical protein